MAADSVVGVAVDVVRNLLRHFATVAKDDHFLTIAAIIKVLNFPREKSGLYREIFERNSTSGKKLGLIWFEKFRDFRGFVKVSKLKLLNERFFILRIIALFLGTFHEYLQENNLILKKLFFASSSRDWHKAGFGIPGSRLGMG